MIVGAGVTMFETTYNVDMTALLLRFIGTYCIGEIARVVASTWRYT